MWLVKMLLAIWRSSENLRGITNSRTTQVNAVVLASLAFAVSGLGYFLPDFKDQDLQQSLLLFLLAVSGVIVQRMAGYKDRRISAEAAQVMLVGVRKRVDKAWHVHHGTILDANVEGWDFGFDVDGYIWDVKKFVRTGDIIPRRKGTDAQSAAVVGAFVDKVKGNQAR